MERGDRTSRPCGQGREEGKNGREGVLASAHCWALILVEGKSGQEEKSQMPNWRVVRHHSV